MILGKNLILAISGSPLAAAKSCNIQQSQSFIQVASPTAARWKQVVPEALEWSISADCLIGTFDAYNTLNAAWKNGTALTIRYYDSEYDCNETGTAYIANLDLKGSVGSLAQMSIQLQGSGELITYNGTNISTTKSLVQSGKYYIYTANNIFSVVSGANGKIYAGSINLTKRTFVKITTNGNDIFLSQNGGLVTKAQNAQDITPSDYTIRTPEDSKYWLDAGTWYFVDSNSNYQYNPTFTAVS